MKTVMVLLMIIPAISALNAQVYNCGNLPADVDVGICYGYAMARAFGYTGSTAAGYRPSTSWLSSQYFSYFSGTGFKEGDIVQWGPVGVDPRTGLNGSNGHAAYVKQINVSNKPDGDLETSATGVARDEDPIPPTDWSNIYVAEVNGDGAGETPSILLSTVNTRELGKPNGAYKGYWRLRDEYKCTITFSNSIGGTTQIFVGKDDEGNYLNRNSGFSDEYTHNATIPAKAEATHTVGGIKWNFSNLWKKGETDYASTQEITATVSFYNADYIAHYSSGGSPSTSVFFENQSDNLPIYSIIRVNNQDKLSKTPAYAVGTAATAYQYLLSDRVHYTFSQWSTGSTNLTLTTSSAGTYVAHYNFDYVLPPDELSPYGNAVGQSIKITWRKVSNAYAYVDTIEVWRKVKNVHSALLLARLSPTATQYIDNDYQLTSGYTDNLIDYDIRLRYKTPARTVYSSTNWFTVFGEQAMERPMDSELVLSSTAPENFALSSYPNPFNPSTTISYTLERSSYVEMSVFDITGRRVRVISQQDKPEGMNTLIWDATDNNGQKLASGTYILQIAVYPHDGSSAFTAARKLILTR